MNKKKFLEWLGPSAEYHFKEKEHYKQEKLFSANTWILKNLEVPTPYELLDSRHLGEGDWGGDEWSVYRFDCSDGPLWVKFHGFYRSYNYDGDTGYTHYTVVTPQTKIITVYE
jgi:hypothetical protein